MPNPDGDRTFMKTPDNSFGSPAKSTFLSLAESYSLLQKEAEQLNGSKSDKIKQGGWPFARATF
jgi:hypothetical protein